MSLIPFRRRSSLPSFLFVLGAVAAAAIGFAATMTFLNWQSSSQQTSVVVLRPDPGPNPAQSGRIEVIDGDTVRFNGDLYRLVGIDTPESGDRARCDDERRRAEAATMRLRALIGSGDARLVRVAWRAGPDRKARATAITADCAARFWWAGRDVGATLISECLAHPYVCEATSCPQRRPWC